ncbi:DUF4199 domain-containing protein [Echinicola vietnamensis]|uniref:DUF4199 domain-containing protein n=1 Tax=Echinicola vietnamensis (strain DSM 17526 / LMG 23754 / KMM 6221) TaxID=926556 RepID=L0G3H6_ECHVK|nr:DUF4199 domain-containing protein [Echinicola vietnamensis]AGA80794.1 hypothetical protein Echvi_4622 [Echinicola vietnamensis DSM 17526]
MTKYFKGGYLFGIVGGVFCLLAFWVLYWIGLEPIDFTLLFACLITPVFVFIGTKNYRDTEGQGEMLFAQGMTVGFVIYGLVALITALGIALFLEMDSTLFDSYKAEKITYLQGKEAYISENVDQDAYDSALAAHQKMSVWDVVLDVFLKIFMLELFFTIIISIILKRIKN